MSQVAPDTYDDQLHAQHEARWLRAWRIVLTYMIAALGAAMIFAPPRIQALVGYGCSAVIFLWIYFGDALLWRIVRRDRGQRQPVRA